MSRQRCAPAHGGCGERAWRGIFLCRNFCPPGLDSGLSRSKARWMTPSEVPPELARAALHDAPAIASETSPSRRRAMAAESVARILTRYEERRMEMIDARNRSLYAK